MMEKIKTFFKFSEEDKKQVNKKYFQVTPNVCICDDFIATLKSDGTVTIPNNCDFQWDNIVKICGGSNHVVGLQADGKVLAFGDNTFTQCDTSNWKNVKDIFAKDNITIGVTYQDELYIAGALGKTYSENIRNEYESKLKTLRQEIESLRYSNEQFLTMQAELKKSIAILENQFNDLQTHASEDFKSREINLKNIDSRIKNLESLMYLDGNYDEVRVSSQIQLNFLKCFKEKPADSYITETNKYIGQVFHNQYRVNAFIDTDTATIVHKGYDIIFNRIVTITLIKSEYSADENGIKRLKKEFEKILAFSNLLIEKVYDANFAYREYIITEYLDSINLQEYMNQNECISWEEAIHFCVQILSALHYAHERNVIHGDIKPKNVIILKDGNIKIRNFGIVRCLNIGVNTSNNMDVQYISPEQARGSHIDQRSDIYSVGVMLYRMLTGQYPFSADSAVAIAIMKLQNDPEPIRRINADIPEMLEEITLKAMNKSPDDRFGSAKEMLDAIEIFKKNPHQKLSDITQRIDTNSSENTADMTDKS